MSAIPLRRSVHHPWLFFLLRTSLGCGCGGGLCLASAVGTGAAVSSGIVQAIGAAASVLAMVAIPLAAVAGMGVAFLYGGRKTLALEGDVVVLRTRTTELARAPLASVRASVRRGRFASLGRRGQVFHFGLGPTALVVGVAEEAPSEWPVASPPELECDVAHGATLRALLLESPGC